MANRIRQSTLRNRYRRQVPGQRTKRIVLGDGSGNVYADPTRQRVWVRAEQADGTFGIPRRYRYVPTMTQFVSNLEVRITSVDGESFVEPLEQEVLAFTGVSPAAIEQGNVVSDAAALAALIPFFSFTPTTATTDSTLIAVTGGYVDRNGTISFVPNLQIDVSGEATSAGEHKVLLVAIKSDNTLEVGSSTAQATAIPFDVTDYQEARDSISADSIPVWYWQATENTGTRVAPGNIPTGDKIFDARILPNAGGGDAGLLGNPNPVTKAEVTGDNRQVLYWSQLSVTTGSMTVGANSQVVVL